MRAQATNGSLFPAAILTLYSTYLAYSALVSEPHDYACNGLGQRLNAASATTLATGMALALVSVVYSALRAGSNTALFRLGAPRDDDVAAVGPAEQPLLDDDLGRAYVKVRGSAGGQSRRARCHACLLVVCWERWARGVTYFVLTVCVMWPPCVVMSSQADMVDLVRAPHVLWQRATNSAPAAHPDAASLVVVLWAKTHRRVSGTHHAALASPWLQQGARTAQGPVLTSFHCNLFFRFQGVRILGFLRVNVPIGGGRHVGGAGRRARHDTRGARRG